MPEESGRALQPAQAAKLARLLDVVLPYPDIDDGPDVRDTVAYVERRLAGEEPALAEALRELLDRVAGTEPGWVAQAATADGTDGLLFRTLRSWAWDGFLADPRHGVNRGGLGWAHFGFPGRPRQRERAS